MTLDEKQSEVPELEKSCERIAEALRNAGDCETAADFKANITDAIAEAMALITALKELR